jgi:nicotinate-nucleotide pyrophosphorylase
MVSLTRGLAAFGRWNYSIISSCASLLSAALDIIQGRVETEASGNVVLETVGDIAATNVDFISSGALTHSVTAMDISLKFSVP